MTFKWNFDKCHKTNRQVSPSSSYLFSSNDNPLLYLIREAVQNSLDARLGKNNSQNPKPVKAIISISAMPKYYNFYFTRDLIDRAKSANIIKTTPSGGVLLVYEDCHTTGLTGSHDSDDARKDSYAGFAFFEGTSNKQTNARGKFGIGKQVFVMLSGLNSYFVLSKTSVATEPEFLFGISTLDFHTYNGNKYEPFGYWGYPRQGVSSNPLPVTESMGKDELDRFRKLFNIKRNRNDSGTSIIVPFADINYSKDTDKLQEDIISIILNEYLIPVLSKDIIFEVNVHNETFEINDGNIKNFIMNTRDIAQKLFLEELYRNSIFTLRKIEQNQFDLKLSLSRLDITEGKFSGFITDAKLTQSFIDLFNNATLPSLALEISFPMSSTKNTADAVGRMVICISKGYDGITSPYYIRNGLVISHANLKKLTRGLSALVFIPPTSGEGDNINELSNFLNSCENPAHTSWSTSGDQFKRSSYNNNRTYSDGILRTVKQFIFQIEKLVSSRNDVVLKSFFTELFEDTTKKTGNSGSGTKGGNRTGGNGGSTSLKSTFIYDEGTNAYILTINSTDKLTTARFNYLNRDYTKSKYTDSQFTLIEGPAQLQKELGLTSLDTTITSINSNEITFNLNNTPEGCITIKNANRYKMLGVDLA